MRCPYCQHDDSKVLDTTHDSHGGIRRRRECLKCSQRFSSYERPILSTPLIVKQDGTREEFDREKLAREASVLPALNDQSPRRTSRG
jgi:transcriptional repressor NrdR